MDYKDLKAEIKAISEIAASVPEPFREKCFEVLLNKALANQTGGSPTDPPSSGRDADNGSGNAAGDGDDVQVPSHVKAFMRRRGISQEQINSLVMVDGEEFHFLKEPSHGQARRGQAEWALLVALKTGIQHNSLKADPEEVRSMVQEKGYYDPTNFSANFKKGKSAEHFKSVLEPQGSAQGLTVDGEQALADLITELTG